MDKKAQDKWNRIYSTAEIASSNVTKVVKDYAYLLPKEGRALDLACGLAGDAVFLAQQGLNVDAWDISDHVIEKINRFATENGLRINASVKDATKTPPEKNYYDVVTVAHYLDRNIISDLVNSLKPGGLIFYQTFLKEVTPTYSGPSNPDFRLGKNELLKMFSNLNLVIYHEEALLGDIHQGFRNEAMIIAQRT